MNTMPLFHKTHVFELEKQGKGWKCCKHMFHDKYTLDVCDMEKSSRNVQLDNTFFDINQSWSVIRESLNKNAEEQGLFLVPFVFEFDMTAPSTVYQFVWFCQTVKEAQIIKNKLVKIKWMIYGSPHPEYPWIEDLPDELYKQWSTNI